MTFDMGERAADRVDDDTIADTIPEYDPDPLPEYCQYRDEGCELAASCLNCPFDDCVRYRPGGKRRWNREKQSVEITRLYTREGRTVQELADMFGISKRTVQRSLRAVLGARKQEKKR